MIKLAGTPGSSVAVMLGIVVELALLGGPAWADAPCDVVPPLAEIGGTYEVTIGMGLVRADDTLAPLNAQNTFQVSMEAQGELLLMEADDNVVVLEYADAEDDALNYQELDDILNIDADDFPALLGCGLDRLPILIGGGRADTPEGESIDFEYELLLWDYSPGSPPEMMGVLRWGGGGVATARSVLASPMQ